MSAGREPARTFRDLTVWKKAHAFVLAVYEYTSGFPRTEIYGLSAQFRRAAVSVPANIAEGFKKRGDPDKVRFLNIAQGSLEECRYYLVLASDLGYGENGSMMERLDEVSRILDAYAKAILSPVS